MSKREIDAHRAAKRRKIMESGAPHAEKLRVLVEECMPKADAIIIETLVAFSWGWDQAFEVKFGGTLEDWSVEKIVDFESLYKFLNEKVATAEFKFPPHELRENGILKKFWNTFPKHMKEGELDLRSTTLHGDIVQLFTKLLEDELLPNEHKVQAREEIQQAAAYCVPYYRECASTRTWPYGSPLPTIGLPEYGEEYGVRALEGVQRHNAINSDGWELHMELGGHDFGFMDTMSRDRFVPWVEQQGLPWERPGDGDDQNDDADNDDDDEYIPSE